jgi:hypothetical protein
MFMTFWAIAPSLHHSPTTPPAQFITAPFPKFCLSFSCCFGLSRTRESGCGAAEVIDLTGDYVMQLPCGTANDPNPPRSAHSQCPPCTLISGKSEGQGGSCGVRFSRGCDLTALASGGGQQDETGKGGWREMTAGAQSIEEDAGDAAWRDASVGWFVSVMQVRRLRPLFTAGTSTLTEPSFHRL